MSRRFVVEADGGARGNPGPAGYGAVVRDAETGHVLVEVAEAIGQATNNVAEYRGLVAGLGAAVELDSDCTIEVRMDSKLVVEQMSGRWQIKHADMRRLAAQAREVVDPERVRYTWVPREKNKAADRLANEAMDDAAKGRPWRGLLRSQAVEDIQREDAAAEPAAVAPPVPRADVGPGAELEIQIVERRPRPEGALERPRAAPETGVAQNLVEDDGPGPERGQHQQQQHGLDHRVGVGDQRPDTEADRLVTGQGQRGYRVLFHHAIL